MNAQTLICNALRLRNELISTVPDLLRNVSIQTSEDGKGATLLLADGQSVHVSAKLDGRYVLSFAAAECSSTSTHSTADDAQSWLAEVLLGIK